MSLKPLEGDIAIAADATLSKMYRKINELVVDANDNIKYQLKMKNDIAELHIIIRDMRLRQMNLG